ncbi:VWA domain-containing protein [Thalassotalea sp. M1531]|uniref:VWA domain-containing protein n=1 Tax=Thalassotalea algicola TaxID=2716224 RepID=A0A7Y0Q8K1_9GAMM|nr:VWA domain-containing protein [Thalassotalea algicola]NMP32987.1 VWA domain-containing protein [Thalassotalea algicola]
MLSDFHFIRPFWLLGLIALPVIIYLIKRLQVSNSGWTKILPPHLAGQMIEQGSKQKGISLIPVSLLLILVITALAGPSWQKLPQPVYQIERGSVLVLDMSYSMYSTDVSPNRLTRTRYKAIDLLDSLNEGDTGLIAYAGDAFTISPLTEDINNIKLLLPSLSPELMPELGSNPLAALSLAHQMLTNAGHIEGDIYWLTDGIDPEDVADLNQWSNQHPHKLNILGIGTSQGAPIKLPNGKLLKDDLGAIVVPKLSEKLLYGVAVKSRGKYRSHTNDNADIETLVNNDFQQQQEKESENTSQGDQWQEFGPYLVLLVLPLLLTYFRRGALLSLVPLMLILVPTEQANAIDWQSLWQTKDQQGQQAFNQKSYAKAADTFENSMWQGSAHYKAENYQAAADVFAKQGTAEGFYNQGNALAKLQQLDKAIDAYEKALSLDGEHQDAKDNKTLLEQLKKQQEQQQQEQQQDSENQQQGDKQQQDQSQQGDNQNQGEGGEQQPQDQQSDDSGQQQDPSQSNEQQQNSDTQQQNEQQSQSEQQTDQQNDQQASESQAEQSEKQPEQQSTEQQQLTAAEQQANQEKAQKHQQLLKKVTDDPYLLLRNKMQLEYQKRRQEGTNSGVKKKW